tara:strand:+ start:1559 stop:2152 length:594 start_codon:yes stop_codon:yes gene_type:complete
MNIANRFRGFLPVVIDIETGGFDAEKNAILQIAAIQVTFQNEQLIITNEWEQSVIPYPGSIVEEEALKVTGIALTKDGRDAEPESVVLSNMFNLIRKAMKKEGCRRAILVAHNAAFDQQFLKIAIARNKLKRDPFHPFTFIDTASLAAVAYGHTVLREACLRAGIPFEQDKAHDALYDANRTAELFCSIVNGWGQLS